MTCEPEIRNVLFVPGTSFPYLLVVVTLQGGPITIKPVRAAVGTQAKEKDVEHQNWFNKTSRPSLPPHKATQYGRCIRDDSTHLSLENTYPNDPPSLSNAEYALFSKMQSWPRVTFDQLVDIDRFRSDSGREKGEKRRRDDGFYNFVSVSANIHRTPTTRFNTVPRGRDGWDLLTNEIQTDRPVRIQLASQSQFSWGWGALVCVRFRLGYRSGGVGIGQKTRSAQNRVKWIQIPPVSDGDPSLLIWTDCKKKKHEATRQMTHYPYPTDTPAPSPPVAYTRSLHPGKTRPGDIAGEGRRRRLRCILGGTISVCNNEG